MNDFIVMDAETRFLAEDVEGGWSNIEGLGLSSAVTYSSADNSYRFWDHNQRIELCAYLNKKLVVTFNGIMFDSILLLGNDRVMDVHGITSNDTHSWINADIYVEMWRHIFDMDRSDYFKIIEKMNNARFQKGIFNLDGIAKNTINTTKNGSGAMAPNLFKAGLTKELFEYNLQDVRVTLELYRFIQKYRYLVTGGFDVVKF